jgi:hypothetical protein
MIKFFCLNSSNLSQKRQYFSHIFRRNFFKNHNTVPRFESAKVVLKDNYEDLLFGLQSVFQIQSEQLLAKSPNETTSKRTTFSEKLQVAEMVKCQIWHLTNGDKVVVEVKKCCIYAKT